MDQVTKTAFKKVALIVGLAMAVCVGVYFFMGQQAACTVRIINTNRS